MFSKQLIFAKYPYMCIYVYISKHRSISSKSCIIYVHIFRAYCLQLDNRLMCSFLGKTISPHSQNFIFVCSFVWSWSLLSFPCFFVSTPDIVFFRLMFGQSCWTWILSVAKRRFLKRGENWIYLEIEEQMLRL